MKKIITSLVVFAMIASIMSSCNKDNTTSNTNSVQTNLANQVAFIQGIHTSIFNMICQASNDSVLMSSGTDVLNGIHVTYDSTAKIFTFYYSLTKAVDSTTGIVTASLTGGHFRDSASVCVVNFYNFYVGGNLIQGSDKIINLGETAGPIMSFSDSIINTKMINGTDSVTFNANYLINWINGVTTPTTSDDQFTFQGNLSVTTNQSSSVTATITPANALLVTTQCPYIVSGIMNMTMHTLNSSNQPVTDNVIIDFITADGCNSLVNVTVDNTQYTFTLTY